MTSITNEAHGSLADPANETPTDARPVLSVAQAAELLGVSEWLVLQQIRLGALPHKRCGRRIVLSRQRLMAWLNDSQPAGTV
jgi:excisionase family DNA binding protein